MDRYGNPSSGHAVMGHCCLIEVDGLGTRWQRPPLGNWDKATNSRGQLRRPWPDRTATSKGRGKAVYIIQGYGNSYCTHTCEKGYACRHTALQVGKNDDRSYLKIAHSNISNFLYTGNKGGQNSLNNLNPRTFNSGVDPFRC